MYDSNTTFLSLSRKNAASRWETYLQNNLTFAENNEGEYQTDTDATSFLSILDIITNQHTFRYTVALGYFAF